jgi:hypothetical protein
MSTTPNDGGPAFPFGQISETTGQPINGCYHSGMSLRDWFAGQALQGILASPDTVGSQPSIAGYAYQFADAMLAERAMTKGGSA